jgi:hypothetical protein
VRARLAEDPACVHRAIDLVGTLRGFPRPPRRARASKAGPPSRDRARTRPSARSRRAEGGFADWSERGRGGHRASVASECPPIR